MLVFLISVAVVMGVASCIQGATNGALSARIGLPTAVLLNAILVLACALCLWLCAPRRGASEFPTQWYLYLGGLYGLTIIAGAAFAYPRLGAAATTALMIAAQLATALLIDGYGIGTEPVAVTPVRLLGAVLLLVGAVLVLWPKLVGAPS
jgi:transporter family-2 protein